MARISPLPVVVGVDGSPSSLGALDYAARWAVRSRTGLRLVHALLPPYSFAPYGQFLPSEPARDHVRSAIDSWLRKQADQVRHKHPQLTGVHAVQATGHPAAVLIEESERAVVTVVGCRGVGGFTELMLGSTSAQLATYGHGPIAVVRPPVAVALGPEQRYPKAKLGPVLVCYDGSPASKAALRFAADEAALRDVPLIVANVHEGEEAAAKQVLVEAVDSWADDYTGQPIELRPIYSQHAPQWALLEASRDAALTIVGCRGHGGFAGLLLGSVSRALVHHAYGPVVVIHPAEQRKEAK